VQSQPGWLLLVVGLALAALGLAWLLLPTLPWLGHLPGDIVIQKGNSRFYFPITTCVLLSLLLSAVMWLIRWLR
jgi:uncharacterized protein HemY